MYKTLFKTLTLRCVNAKIIIVNIKYRKSDNMKNKKVNKKEVKEKKHFDPAKGAVRIIALLLVITMLIAACGTALFYLVFSIKGII